jgi:hypothetical protein
VRWRGPDPFSDLLSGLPCCAATIGAFTKVKTQSPLPSILIVRWKDYYDDFQGPSVR